MTLNLRELIKASGGAGINGQSFRSNAAPDTGEPPLVDTASVRQYLIEDFAWTGSVPVIDIVGNYASSSLFNITATFTRGARAFLIQRNTSNAWNFFATEGVTVSIETFTSNSGGASHDIGLRCLGPLNASPTMSHNAVSDGTGGTNDPDRVTFTATPGNLGGVGFTETFVSQYYDPDTADFNPEIAKDSGAARFNFRIDNRGYTADADFDYEWRTATNGGGTLIASTRSFNLETDFGWNPGGGDIALVYPTAWEYPDSPYSSNNGLLPGETSQEIYLRWRVKPSSGGNGTWSNYGPVTHTDPRNAV